MSLYRNPLNKSKMRNQPCPCGSGKKTKKCHGQDYAVPKSHREDFLEAKRKNTEALADALKEKMEEKDAES